MKTIHLSALSTVLVLIAGCTTTNRQSAAEASPGKFVTYTCDNKKTFSSRFDSDTKTIRVRSHEGAFEMTKGEGGLYRDDEGQWTLMFDSGNKTELTHKGKPAYSGCSAQT